MCARSGVGTSERKELEEPCVVRTEGWRRAEHPVGWLPAPCTKLGKGVLFRKIPSQNRLGVSEGACAVCPVQTPLQWTCAESPQPPLWPLPARLYSTEPVLLLFTLNTPHSKLSKLEFQQRLLTPQPQPKSGGSTLRSFVCIKKAL